MTAVDQTGSVQADSAVQTEFAAVPAALAEPGYPAEQRELLVGQVVLVAPHSAEQRGLPVGLVPVALAVAVRAERKAAVARVARADRTGAALAELAVQLRVVQVARVAWVAQTGAVPVVLVAQVAQVARSSSAGRIG